MLDSKDFQKIVESVSTPILVARPIFDGENEISDFEVLFVNPAFSKKIPSSFIKEGDSFSMLEPKIGSEIQWKEVAARILKSKNPESKTVYSSVLSFWMRLSISSTDDGLLILSITDVSEEKMREQQLRRQNTRLASLTDEISVSTESLRAKLEKIEKLNLELEQVANVDALTGLKKERSFERDLTLAISSGEKSAVIFAALDNLKSVNDSKGREAGDEIICRTAEILVRFQKEDIKIYRGSGDSFLILVTDFADKKYLSSITEAMLAECNESGIEFSAGIAFYPEDSDSISGLVKAAEKASAQAKKSGKNKICLFSES